MQTKVALVLREDLPMAHAANTSAVLALSLGGRIGEAIGRDGEDASGGVHPGLNTHPIPVLTASAEELNLLLERARTTDGVQLVSLTETARRARDYEDYLTDLKAAPAGDLEYLGVIVHGPRTDVSRLTRRLSLL
ncbi:DUF2000 domain-containing protein [Streptomyces broussonetiae]|uniref:DUF2000 family protein n=1 Tax=Streptomyces broussonetiae TaxID=2686304 RepID=A0A6I6MZA6_9ACTN|nr:DUF2000 domain-containing protein [Streptomyces broussonetiae]QHA04444.1 DUF2000 family protein [Streptomyces broussonetiae]